MSKSKSHRSKIDRSHDKSKAQSKSFSKSIPKHASRKIQWWWFVIPLGILLGAALIISSQNRGGITASPVSATAAVSNKAALQPGEISVDQAFKKYQSGVFFLDVRQPEEWEEYHAPNSTLIPLGELPNRLSELPRDQEIVVVCRSGNRSQQGRDILLNNGFNQVTSMAGGLKTWRDNGYPVVSGK